MHADAQIAQMNCISFLKCHHEQPKTDAKF